MALYLIPNLLGDGADLKMNMVIGLEETLYSMDGFFVENPKNARKFLSNFDFDRLRDKPMELLDKRTENFKELLKPVASGQKWGIISDAGVPCIADPGALMVFEAKKLKIQVEALVGPCSILLALMLSGLPAQKFTFHGYLPRFITPNLREKGTTQVFIETPYNNEKALRILLENLRDNDLLSVAIDLTLPTQEVHTYPVEIWRRRSVDLRKRFAIFLFHAK